MIECKDADYVLAIAKYKTISAAAKSLFISQPALTKYLKSLEQRLGVILFDRNKKKLQPTVAGAHYLRYASELVTVKKRMEDEILRVRNEEKGQLRVGFSCTGLRYIVFDALDILSSRHPSFELDFMELTSPEIERRLIDQTIDIGMITLPSSSLELESQMLFEENLLLGVPKDHPMVMRGSTIANSSYMWIDLSLFRDEYFVLRNKGTHFRATTDNLFQQYNMEPKVLLSTRNHYSTVEVAKRKQILFFIPESFIQDQSASENIEYFLVGMPIAKISSGLICRKNMPLEIAALEFLHITDSLLQERARRNPHN